MTSPTPEPSARSSSEPARSGPLAGLRVIEMSAIGPVPFAGMILADLGADVIRIDRPGAPPPLPGTEPSPGVDVLGRGKRSIVVDLKHEDATSIMMPLVEAADVLVEGSRPGVMERLGLGPDACRARNDRLVYGRMTGYGQDGPLAQEAGHDINYIALAGVLGRIGRIGQPPTPPLNLVGDFGGGAMFLITGVLAALYERMWSGTGQVVDSAMVDGSTLLTAGSFGQQPAGERGTNLLDSGAPFYDTYETADGRYVAVGAIEPQFWEAFVSRLGLAAEGLEQRDRTRWQQTKQTIAYVMKQRTRDEWVEEFAGLDACVAPVLSADELASHPHHRARASYIEVGGVVQPAPAPRFDRSSTSAASPAPVAGQHTDEILRSAGLDDTSIEELRASAAVG